MFQKRFLTRNFSSSLLEPKKHSTGFVAHIFFPFPYNICIFSFLKHFTRVKFEFCPQLSGINRMKIQHPRQGEMGLLGKTFRN